MAEAEAVEHSPIDSESEKRNVSGTELDQHNEKGSDEQEFEAIRTPRQRKVIHSPLKEVRSRSSARSHKSYDGYTVDPDDDAAVDTGGPVDPNRAWEVQFDGEDDPMNPRNKSTFRKWLVVIIVAFSSLCVTCASALYTVSFRPTVYSCLSEAKDAMSLSCL